MPADHPNTSACDVILHGVAPDSGNLGLNALCSALIDCLGEFAPDASLGVLGYSRGIEPMAGASNAERIGAYHTRRLHRNESLWNIRLCARLGGLSNPIARRIRGASAFLDASGGDSFTDLYGMRRFWSMVRPKQIAMENGVPLVFLPQTYGPFRSSRTRRVARDLVRRRTPPGRAIRARSRRFGNFWARISTRGSTARAWTWRSRSSREGLRARRSPTNCLRCCPTIPARRSAST